MQFIDIIIYSINNKIHHYMYIESNKIFELFSIFNFKFICKKYILEFQEFQLIKMDSEKMIKSLREFIQKNNFNIEVWKLFNDFKNIKDKTFFVLYIRLCINEKEVINKDYSQIYKILNNILLEQYNIDKKLINNITNNYEVISTAIYDNVGKYTFNYKVNPKVCKYCNNSDKKYFSNESHIIPENISGHLIDSLECDKCNSWFNENIEQDFSNFLDVQKTLFGIKGKKGIPKIINNDFNVKYDNLNGKYRLTFTIKNPKITPYNIKQHKFEITKDINLHNLYKTLCKIALGVIDYKQIEIFSDTIKWIKDLNVNTKIPMVILNNHINIIDHLNRPYVYVYIRKNNDYNIPYACAELNCRFMSFYYIIPFSKNDRNNFLNKDEVINLFKDIFYIKSDNYRILDCNENKKTDFKYRINLDLK